MGTITLDNVRATSDITMRVRLKDSGTAIDWSALTDIKAWLYSDAQKAISGRCDVSVDQGDRTVLICEYSGQKPQYLGVNKIIVQANYMERLKTYDKPALNIVRWTDEVDGLEVVLVDPVVNVEIEVTDVSSSVLDNAIAAAVAAAERADEAAAAAEHMVDIHQGPPGPSGISPIIGQNGNWWTWDDELKEYVDSGDPSRGPQGIPGVTPNISIGTVTTGEPGDPAEASFTGTPEAPVLNMTIPQGPQGNPGEDGVGLESASTPATPDGTVDLNLSDGTVLKMDLNHDHPAYPKYQLCANETEYQAIVTKESDKLYLIPEA